MEMKILRAGPLTTVQDLGRTGHLGAGVPQCGAMDEMAIRITNLLVGNSEAAAVLEATMTGPVVSFSEDCVVCVGGATVSPLQGWRSTAVRRGQELDLRALSSGFRLYLAVRGGIDVPPVLGSRSTDLRVGLGGLDGRRLRDGDRLPIGRTARDDSECPNVRPVDAIIPPYSPQPTLRVLAGEHVELLDPAVLRAGVKLVVSAESDRVGVRLGTNVTARQVPSDLPSRVVFPGTVQLPPDGRPIILGPDAGTIGGYAVVGHVASVDMPLLAQLRPGNLLSFLQVTLGEAHRAHSERERTLAVFRAGIEHRT